MEREISFAPCYDLYHEMGARPGFSFVDTAKFREEDCTDGSWEDITLRASRDQPGDATTRSVNTTRSFDRILPPVVLFMSEDRGGAQDVVRKRKSWRIDPNF